MIGVAEIEVALRQLSRQDKWLIAHWLLEDLEMNGQDEAAVRSPTTALPLPDYAARRRRIFGEKVLPNMVLVTREEDRW